MKTIPLTQNSVALIDDQDFDLVSQFKWYKHSEGYAVTTVRISKGVDKKIYMHRMIMQAQKGQMIDHDNQNKLDNQRYNLRIANKSLNAFNSKTFKTNKSGYRGVSWSGVTKKWIARITINREVITLGYFEDRKEAYAKYISARPCQPEREKYDI